MTKKNNIKNQKGPRPQKKTKVKKQRSPYFGQRIFASILIVIVVFALLAVGAFSVFAKDIIDGAPDLYVEDFIQPESSKIYDVEGNEFYDTGMKIRENITYDDLPQSLIDAFVAVEDSRFFEHNGFDVPRFTKAALENLMSSLREGQVSFGQGGSTFTMQLIKNTYFLFEDYQTGEVILPEGGVSGIDRKVQEIYLSQKLENEQMLSKKLIFELYLNMINFGAGNNIVGIENSAEAYFGKDVSQLNLLESAFLAGVINAPSKNSPYNSIENATKRTHTVLDLMKLHGYINDDELKLAKSMKLENLLIDSKANRGEALPYQAYIDVVIDEVVELTGNNPSIVPMKIYTSMDPKIQDGIDKFQRREIAELDQGKDSHIQVGSAVIENTTGAIIGIVGGYDYHGELVHNRAAAKSVVPASVIKPVVDYALGFEYLGYATSHVLVDEPWQYAGTDFTVGNYDNQYKGEITLMHAVADSRNVPALKTLQAAVQTIGREATVKYLNDVGFSKVTVDNFDIGYGIGGSSFTTSPIEIAGAFTMIMNDGNFIEPHTVDRIEFTDGREPLVPDHASMQVISDSAAYLTTRTMKYAVEGPYPGYLRSVRKPYPVFAKTGTNAWGEDRPSYVPENSQRDRLMMASTDRFTMATWVGFDKYGEEIKPWFSAEEYTFNLPGKLNSYLLDLLQENYGSGKEISRPSGVVDIEHITGPFPYQSPLDDMNPSLISNGMIKKEFLNLTSAKPQDLKSLESQDVKATQSGNNLKIEVKMTPYPDKDKLTVADNVLVMKFPGTSKTTTGTRMYDDTWIFGAVRYKSELLVDGKVVKETVGDSEKQTLDYTLTGNEKDVKVVSYYTYDLNKTMQSNTLEKSVEVKAIDSLGPSSNVYSVLNDWAQGNGIPVEVDYEKTDDINKHMTVTQTDPDIIGKPVNMKKLKKSGLKMEVNEYVLDVQDGQSTSVLNPLKAFMQFDNPEGIIKEIRLDGKKVDEINLRKDQYKRLIIVLESSND